MQLSELRDYCASRGWEISYEFRETASGADSSRPLLKQAMDLAKQRKYDVLLVWKLDRLGRSMVHLVKVLEGLEEVGVEFCSLKDAFDCTTSAGRLMMNLLGCLAQFERDLIVERVKSGLANARRKGVKLGRRKEFDYEEISQMRVQGMTYQEIRNKLGCSNWVITQAIRCTETPLEASL